jgi:hypothetical protein
MRLLSLIFIGSLLFVHCTTSTADTESSTPTAFAPTDTVLVEDFGMITAIEDSGYPYYYVEIEFPERQFKETFLLDISELESIDPQILMSWLGKYVSFTYTSTLVNDLLDIQVNDVSILGNEGMAFPEGVMMISGTLSGAYEVTPGDRPVKISITDPEEASYTFDFFVTPEMVEVEGTLVKGYFTQRTLNQIKSVVSDR